MPSDTTKEELVTVETKNEVDVEVVDVVEVDVDVETS